MTEDFRERITPAFSTLIADAAQIEIQELEGLHSLTNTIRKVTDPATGREFAVRIPNLEAGKALGIDRVEEMTIQGAAANAGLAPAVLATTPDGVVVMPFFTEAHRWSGADMVEGERGVRLAAVMRNWLATTELPETLPTMYERIRRMVAGAESLNAPLPDQERLLAKLAEIEAERAADQRYPLSIAHHDLYPNNLLDTGDDLFVIDYEFAGVGDGWYDLSTIARSAGLDDDGRRVLLESVGRPSSPADVAILGQLDWVGALFDGVWGWIMAAVGANSQHGEGSFDYAAHAENMLKQLH